MRSWFARFLAVCFARRFPVGLSIAPERGSDIPQRSIGIAGILIVPGQPEHCAPPAGSARSNCAK